MEISYEHSLEELVEFAYKIAGKFYYDRTWFRSVIDKGDFVQEAAMFVVKKFNEGTFNNIPIDKVKGYIYISIKNWFSKNLQEVNNKYAITEVPMNHLFNQHYNEDYDGFEDDKSTLLADETPHADNLFNLNTDWDEGKNIFNKLISQLDDTPYHTIKDYSTYIPEFKAVKKPSDRLLGTLLLFKDNRKEISMMFAEDKDVKYYGWDSKAQYIATKLTKVVEKLKEKTMQLNQHELISLRTYIDNIEGLV